MPPVPSLSQLPQRAGLRDHWTEWRIPWKSVDTPFVPHSGSLLGGHMEAQWNTHRLGSNLAAQIPSSKMGMLIPVP